MISLSSARLNEEVGGPTPQLIEEHTQKKRSRRGWLVGEPIDIASVVTRSAFFVRYMCRGLTQ